MNGRNLPHVQQVAVQPFDALRANGYLFEASHVAVRVPVFWHHPVAGRIGPVPDTKEDESWK
jgi:hypothetical protein